MSLFKKARDVLRATIGCEKLRKIGYSALVKNKRGRENHSKRTETVRQIVQRQKIGHLDHWIRDHRWKCARA